MMRLYEVAEKVTTKQYMVDFNFDEYCTLEVANSIMAHVTHDLNLN